MEGDGDESLVNEGEAEALLSVTEVGLRVMFSDCVAAWSSFGGVVLYEESVGVDIVHVQKCRSAEAHVFQRFELMTTGEVRGTGGRVVLDSRGSYSRVNRG